MATRLTRVRSEDEEAEECAALLASCGRVFFAPTRGLRSAADAAAAAAEAAAEAVSASSLSLSVMQRTTWPHVTTCRSQHTSAYVSIRQHTSAYVSTTWPHV
jgi:hypothetical protein